MIRVDILNVRMHTIGYISQVSIVVPRLLFCLAFVVGQKIAKNQYALLPGISVTVLASHFSSEIGNFRSSGRLDLHV